MFSFAHPDINLHTAKQKGGRGLRRNLQGFSGDMSATLAMEAWDKVASKPAATCRA